jgi:hypothetical protein
VGGREYELTEVEGSRRSGSRPWKCLQLLVEFAARAGNKDAAWCIALTVFYALYDTRRLAAFRAIGALGSIHDFLAVCRFGDLSHDSIFSWDVGFPRP